MAISNSQERANERARALGFANDYERRKAKLAELGTTPRKQRDASARLRGVPRDYALERERADIRARSQGFSSVRQQREFNRAVRAGKPVSKSSFLKKQTLAYFGISEKRFNDIRRENRNYADEYGGLNYTEIYGYNEQIDGDENDWSEQRVGYIISFHAAVVNPHTNYDSLPRKWVRGSRKAGTKGKWVREVDSHGHIITNDSQFFYLVKYAGLMSVDYFEARYGRGAIVQAAKNKTPKP